MIAVLSRVAAIATQIFLCMLSTINWELICTMKPCKLFEEHKKNEIQKGGQKLEIAVVM